METRHYNRLRNRDIEYSVEIDLPESAAGALFFKAVLDSEVGEEIVLLLVDQTDFASRLAPGEAFNLNLKTGAVRTSLGPLVFFLWWVPPVTDGMPFALYEHLLNPTDPDMREMLQRAALQTHLHLLVVGPGQEVIGRYELENNFALAAVLPIFDAAAAGSTLDLRAAKREYEQQYDLRKLFQMDPGDQEESGQAETDAPSEIESLEWESVEKAARSGFNVWLGQPELVWGRRAYQILAASGLLNDSDAFSHHVAVFRFLALAGIYHDFCEAAWDETSYIDYWEWCEPPDLVDRFNVGQLYARLPDWEPDEEIEVAQAIDRLVEAERETVVEALVKGFGDIPGLYASLWRSRDHVDGEGEEDEEDDESDLFECFEPDDAGKVQAYQWVSEGCSRRSD